MEIPERKGNQLQGPLEANGQHTGVQPSFWLNLPTKANCRTIRVSYDQCPSIFAVPYAASLEIINENFHMVAGIFSRKNELPKHDRPIGDAKEEPSEFGSHRFSNPYWRNQEDHTKTDS